MASRLPLIVTCALFASAAGAAYSAELGEARISSYIGQHLVADIELLALDHPATPVQARLAHPNVYRGANIGMPQVLSTLTMTVMQRDGRQFLHLTSTAPVESSHLHLYLELADGAQRDVRLATLWMAPNPNPPPPPPVRAPLPVPAAAIPAPAAASAAPPRLQRPLPHRTPVVVAKLTRTPELPPKPAPKPVPKKEARLAQKTQPKLESRPEPQPVPIAAPLPLAAAAAPAACVPTSEVDRSTVCAALDYKNAQLREQIGQLEGKVRVLQVAMGASPSAVERSTPVGPGNAAKPHPVRHRPLPEPAAQTPWGTIASATAAVLALLGGGLLLMRRRKRTGRIQPMPTLPLMARLKQRFARKKMENKGASEALEPQLDEAAHETSTQL